MIFNKIKTLISRAKYLTKGNIISVITEKTSISGNNLRRKPIKP